MPSNTDTQLDPIAAALTAAGLTLSPERVSDPTAKRAFLALRDDHSVLYVFGKNASEEMLAGMAEQKSNGTVIHSTDSTASQLRASIANRAKGQQPMPLKVAFAAYKNSDDVIVGYKATRRSK